MVYICSKCNKSFDHKGHYINHLKRKTSCSNNYSNSNNDINLDNDIILKILMNHKDNIIYNNVPKIEEDDNKDKGSNQCNDEYEDDEEVEVDLNINTNININKNKNKKILKQLKCEYCNKLFSRKFTLERHLDDNCKVKKGQKDITTINNGKIKIMEEQMNKLIEENKELKNDINKLKISKEKKITNHYLNNVVNVGSINTINTTITNNLILKFGREDIYKLNDDDKYKILFEKGLDPILESIERTHFNNRIPNQQNIHLTNINSKYLNLYNGKTWEKNKLDTATDTLIENHAYNLSLMVDECDDNKKPKIKNSVNKSIKMVNDYFKLENDDLEYLDEKSKKDKELIIRNEITELKENVKLKLYNKTQEIQQDKILTV